MLCGFQLRQVDSIHMRQCYKCYMAANYEVFFPGKAVLLGQVSRSVRCSRSRLCWPTTRTSGDWLWMDSSSMKTQIWLLAHCQCNINLLTLDFVLAYSGSYMFCFFFRIADPAQRENLGIIVQYKVKVKLCLGPLGG